MNHFQVKPCPRDYSDDDLWCSACDDCLVKLDDESTGNFYAHIGMLRAAKMEKTGRWVHELVTNEQVVWACCTRCLNAQSAT